MLVADAETLGGERAKLLDFGLAKIRAATQAVRQSTPGLVMGTPTYMAPEQVHDSSIVDGKADVYSLAVILYQLVAGRPPFVNKDTLTLLNMHLSATPPPLTRFCPAVPPSFADLLLRMLDKDPSARPPMSQVVERLVVMDAPSPLASFSGPFRVARLSRQPSAIELVEMIAEPETPEAGLANQVVIEPESSQEATLRRFSPPEPPPADPSIPRKKSPPRRGARLRFRFAFFKGPLQGALLILAFALWPQPTGEIAPPRPGTYSGRHRVIALPLTYGPPAPSPRAARPGRDRKDHRPLPCPDASQDPCPDPPAP